MDNVLEGMEKDLFAKFLGIEILRAGDGKAEGRLTIEKRHLNAMGVAHGGAIFTLADTILAAAANSREGTAVAVNVSISYCKAGRPGTLIARAKEVSLNRKLATYIVEIMDEQDNLIALFQGTVYRKE